MSDRLCTRLGIDLPIVQAPIGNAATPELAAAVAEAGGLGMLSLSWSTPDQIRRLIAKTRALSARPFGINLVLEWPQHERLRIALAEGVRIVSTFWGDPAGYVQPVHEAGGVLLHTVGSMAEAAQAIAAGVDVIVAQGIEAGGHVRGDVPLADLLATLAATAAVPVLAAGGITDAGDVSAALAAGADGVWLGTRFVCSREADAAGVYQQRIMLAGPDDTVLTTAFSSGWPDAPHRVLRNGSVRAWEDAGRPATAPGSGEIIAHSASGAPIERYAFALPTKSMTGQLDAMALYAGLGAAGITDVQPAGRLVRQLAAGL